MKRHISDASARPARTTVPYVNASLLGSQLPPLLLLLRYRATSGASEASKWASRDWYSDSGLEISECTYTYVRTDGRSTTGVDDWSIDNIRATVAAWPSMHAAIYVYTFIVAWLSTDRHCFLHLGLQMHCCCWRWYASFSETSPMTTAHKARRGQLFIYISDYYLYDIHVLLLILIHALALLLSHLRLSDLAPYVIIIIIII